MLDDNVSFQDSPGLHWDYASSEDFESEEKDGP